MRHGRAALGDSCAAMRHRLETIFVSTLENVDSGEVEPVTYGVL
jgi:hypothetical protein